ncbi:MAG: hypothetical protein V1915_00410 [Candidatus Bathyarchaeota archaeon]
MKRRTTGRNILEEKHVLNLEEAAERTGNRLRNLGNQRFALPPFKEHFGLWLLNLKEILIEFEATPTLEIDDPYRRECKEILENIEADLTERGKREAFSRETTQNLFDSRVLLNQIDAEYVIHEKEIIERKTRAINDLSIKIEHYKEELTRQPRITLGIVELLSKKARVQRETEMTQKLNFAQRERILVEQRFVAEQEKLRDEYMRRKTQVSEKISAYQEEKDAQDIDSSLETRRATCEALDKVVKVLVQQNLSTRNP